MISLYGEKNKIPVKIIEYIKRNKLDVKIKKIDNQFPGTIISIRFIFKNEYIEDTKEDN